jgi:hypothetical protein
MSLKSYEHIIFININNSCTYLHVFSRSYSSNTVTFVNRYTVEPVLHVSLYVSSIRAKVTQVCKFNTYAFIYATVHFSQI